MRHIDDTLFKTIADEIKRFLIKNGRKPTHRELSEVSGLSKSTINKYLIIMKQKGLIEGGGRHLDTEETKLLAVPIVDSLINSKHTYDEAEVEDFYFISEKVLGKGEFGMIRAVDNSMLYANIRPSYILVKRQKTANIGQIILARTDTGKYVLRRYVFDEESQTAILRAESPDEYKKISIFEIRGNKLVTESCRANAEIRI